MMVRSMQAERDDQAATRRHRVEWLAFAGVVVLLAACVALLQAQARSRALEQQSERLQVQARVVGDNVLLQATSVDNALSGVRDDFLGDIADPAALQSAQQRFRALASALPGVRAILVLDAHGTVLAATRDELLGKKFSGRDYFARPRDRPDRDVLYVSRPFETTQGEWVMPVSRALLDRQGRFVGVVVAGLDSRYLAVVLRSVLYAPDMDATLAHGDGDLFLRVAGASPAANRPVHGATLLAAGRPTAAIEEPQMRTAGNPAEERLVASRLVEPASPRLSPPMAVEITRSVDAILVSWRHDNLVLAGMFGLTLLLSAIGLRLLQSRRHDVAELAERARSLQEQANRRIRTVTDSLPALVAYIDGDHRYRFANARYRTFYQLDPEALVGRPMAEVIGEDAHDGFATRIAAVLKGEPQQFQQHGVAGKSDVFFSVDFLPDVEADGSIPGFFVMVTDITALKLAERKLEALALFDTLTGLPNRHQFSERLAGLLASTGGTPKRIGLMFLDVDHFKSINDSLGHAAGDEVLREFGRRLQSVARPTDCVARLAGDEFVMLLEGIDDPAALGAVAQKVLAAMVTEFMIDGQALRVSTSIGVAHAMSGAMSPPALLAAADAALYKAKALGRATFAMAI